MWVDRAAAWLLALQRDVYAALGERIRGMDASAEGFAGAILFALALGAVHALTPGHGKSVVFSYFLGAPGRAWSGVAMGAKVAATHIVSALVLVALFGAATGAFGRPSGVARGIQIASYALIVAVGLWLVWRAIAGARRRRERRAEPARDHAKGALPFAVGLLPCPMTMLVMTYAVANASVAGGLVLVAVLGVGVALTIAAVGSLGILLRRGALGRLDPAGRVYAGALAALEIASAVAVVVLGVVFLAGALA